MKRRHRVLPREILETLWSSGDMREQIDALENAEKLGGLESLCEMCESDPVVGQIARATWVLNACAQDGDFVGRVLGWEREQAGDWAESLWQRVGETDKREIISEIHDLSVVIAREYETIGDSLVGADGARELAKWWRETVNILSIQQV